MDTSNVPDLVPSSGVLMTVQPGSKRKICYKEDWACKENLSKMAT